MQPAEQANIISLILSDVIGNPLEAIASGPTVPDPTTKEDAIAILKKYDAEKQASKTIYQFLESGSLLPDSKQQVSPRRHGDAVGLQKVQNMIVGDNRLAALAALKQAEQEGFYAHILTNELQGEAREVGVMLAQQLHLESTRRHRPFCLIAGGETTVKVKGQGRGGRNQESATRNRESGAGNVL